jgi:hypothetical protein
VVGDEALRKLRRGSLAVIAGVASDLAGVFQRCPQKVGRARPSRKSSPICSSGSVTARRLWVDHWVIRATQWTPASVPPVSSSRLAYG